MRFLIALTATAGGVVLALIGWLESGDVFDVRKFGASCLRSLIAGVLFAVGSDGSDVIQFFYAFLGGAGVDAIGKGVSGALGNSSFPFHKTFPARR